MTNKTNPRRFDPKRIEQGEPTDFTLADLATLAFYFLGLRLSGSYTIQQQHTLSLFHQFGLSGFPQSKAIKRF